MNHATAFPENTLHGALELSKTSWVLAIQFPDRQQPNLYRINGGDTEDLMSKLAEAAILGPKSAVCNRRSRLLAAQSRRPRQILRAMLIGRTGPGRKNGIFRSNKRKDVWEITNGLSLISGPLIQAA